MSTQPRKPAGAAGSTGGQYAETPRAEADIVLREDRPSDIFFEADLDEKIFTNRLRPRLAALYPDTPGSDIAAWSSFIDGTYGAFIVERGRPPTQGELADIMDPVMAAISERDRRYTTSQPQVSALSEHHKYLSRLAFLDPETIGHDITALDPTLTDRVHAARGDIHALADIAASMPQVKADDFSLHALGRDFGPAGRYARFRPAA